MRRNINNKFIFEGMAIVLISFFLLTGLALAQTGDGTTSDSDKNTPDTETINKKRVLRPSDIPRKTKADLEAVKRNTADDRVNDLKERTDVSDLKKSEDKNQDKLNAGEIKTRLEDKKTELQNRADENREEKKIELNEKRKDRVRAYLERIVHRFRAAISRLEKLIVRIESRIEKLEEDKSLDLSDATALLEKAKIELSDAKSTVEGVLSAGDSALTEEDPKSAFGRVKEILNGAKDSIKSAHKSLVEAIRLVKASVSDENESPEAVTN